MRITRKNIKGQNGRILIVGGSKDYVGAPALSALGAMRTGADIVTVCAPERVAWAINNYSPAIITKKFLGDALGLTHTKEIIAMSEEYDVVLLGPGLGEKKEFVMKLLRDIKKPFVIDADALKVIALDVVSDSILTPHAGEFRQLFANTIRKREYDEMNMENNIKVIREKLGNNVMLLKGTEDIIFTKHRRHRNKTGHNSMTRGGTGDILAGVCAGYLALSKDPFDSAKQAAHTNGRLGEYMYKQKGYGYTAFDMVEELWRFIK